jgi:CheY-like chemotaxis protein
MDKRYILLIDDDQDEFEFFSHALEKLPGIFECGYASGAADAFTEIARRAPDFIFMDVNMPAVNGLECTRRIREHAHFSSIPIFIYTTGYDEALRRESVLAGANGCVRKPSRQDALVALLKGLSEKGTI